MKHIIEMAVAVLFCVLFTVNVIWRDEASTTMLDCRNWAIEEFWEVASANDVVRCFDNRSIDLESQDRYVLGIAARYGATAEGTEALGQAGVDISAKDDSVWTSSNFIMDFQTILLCVVAALVFLPSFFVAILKVKAYFQSKNKLYNKKSKDEKIQLDRKHYLGFKKKNQQNIADIVDDGINNIIGWSIRAIWFIALTSQVIMAYLWLDIMPYAFLIASTGWLLIKIYMWTTLLWDTFFLSKDPMSTFPSHCWPYAIQSFCACVCFACWFGIDLSDLWTGQIFGTFWILHYLSLTIIIIRAIRWLYALDIMAVRILSDFQVYIFITGLLSLLINMLR